MKDFTFKSSFSSIIKPLVSEEKDLYLAQASLAQIGSFIPDIDPTVNLDCLAIAFNAFVVNRVNKNGDYVDTDTAISFYKNFINKPINANHNRSQVCGVILTAGFSEFGSDAPLSEEQIKTLGKEPFNVVLGGLVWRLVNPQLAAIIEDSNDPTSEDYLSISASWELGFSDYGVGILPIDAKDTSKAIEVTEECEASGYSKYLKANGGNGEYNDQRIYRKILAPALPLGIGLTETPAADVKGIFVEMAVPELKSEKVEAKRLGDSQEKISQTELVTVIREYNKVMIKDFSELNDEVMKQISASEIKAVYEAQASSIHKLYEEKIKEASEKYCAEQTASAQKLKEVEASSAALVEAVEVNKVELAEVKKQLELLLTEKAAATAQDLFNGRMSHFDVEYDLTDADRTLIAADIKEMTEESFAQYQAKMNTLMKEKMKSFKTEAKESSKIEVLASVQDLVDVAIDSGKKDVITIPHTSSAQEGIFDKFKKAFSEDGFTIKY